MLLKTLSATAAAAAGSWMGQYFRTAATVPDELPEAPRLTLEHLLPAMAVSLALSQKLRASWIGAMLLGFNLSFCWSFLLGNEQSRRWLKGAQRG
ncbi:MAG TPA: hypothetical protein DEP84_35465 [Chloroflexi bacterium]|nr:hypothetical protein [Chloroflexota bacterium]